MSDHGSDEEIAPETESVAVYLRLRRVLGEPGLRSADARRRETRVAGDSTAFGAGRDPEELGAVLEGMTQSLGWSSPLARGELLVSWPELVGPEVAAHCEPAGIDEGVLTVQCDSTAWATQLRIMRADILTTIVRRFPEAQVQSIRFIGPGAPSWKRGPRSVPGRGPRDTYG